MTARLSSSSTTCWSAAKRRLEKLSPPSAAGCRSFSERSEKLALLSENPTLARAVAAASMAANRAGSGSGELNRDDLKLLEAPLKQPNGKPLKASPAMDVWSLGMIAYELFVNEPFFAGCSDDVALQVLASAAPLDVPSARIPDPQAEHLLSKMLQKRPRQRTGLAALFDTAVMRTHARGGDAPPPLLDVLEKKAAALGGRLPDCYKHGRGALHPRICDELMGIAVVHVACGAPRPCL